jgi:ribosome-associated protein
MRSKELALMATEAALEKKGLEPVLLDVTEQGTYTDFILVISGRSDRHVQAVADGVLEAMKLRGRRPIGVEGKRDGHWTLLDFGDFIVHVFYHPMREFYDLEGMWVDAPRVALDVPAESRVQVNDAYGM